MLWVVINKVISRNSKLTFFNSVQSRAGPIVGLERFLTVRKAGRCLEGPTQDIDTDAKQDTLVKIGPGAISFFSEYTVKNRAGGNIFFSGYTGKNRARGNIFFFRIHC